MNSYLRKDAWGKMIYLGEAKVCAHALAGFVDVPDLDLSIQAGRQQQVTRLRKEPAQSA